MPLENLTPATRIEAYLAKIAGEDIITPEVKTRLEYYLNEIAQNGGGGGAGLPAVTEADDGKVLGVVGGEWNKMDKGWNVTNIYNTFVEEQTVTTQKELPEDPTAFEFLTYEEAPTVGAQYKVTLNGEEYILTAYEYGDIIIGNLSDVGFEIHYSNLSEEMWIETPEAGTYEVKIEVASQQVETTDDFDVVRGYGFGQDYTLIDDEDIYVNDELQHQAAMPGLGYGVLESGETYRVTYDNTEYIMECKLWRLPTDTEYTISYLGDFDSGTVSYDNYPFCITDDPQEQISILSAQELGNHEVTIEKLTKTAHTTSDFDLAVQSVINGNAPLMVYGGFVDDYPVFMNDDNHEYTYQQLADIIDSGRVVYLRVENGFVDQLAAGYEIVAGKPFNNVVPIIHENNAVKVRFAFYATIADNLVICVIDMYQSTNEPHATIIIHKSDDHEN